VHSSKLQKVSVYLQARRFWGDVYFHPESRTFKKKAASPGQDRTFVSVSFDEDEIEIPLPSSIALTFDPYYCSMTL